MCTLIAACGGGSNSDSLTAITPPSASTPPSSSQTSIVGKVLFPNENNPSSAVPLDGFNLQARSISKVQTLNSNNLNKYLCYNILDIQLDDVEKDLTSILKDIDVNNDGVPDINISYPVGDGSIAYKNISVESFKYDEIPSPEEITSLGYDSLSELFIADHFIFDMYEDLEPNIDTDDDGEPDQNITSEFILDDVSVQSEPQIFFNINHPESDLVLNQIPSSFVEQHEDILLINHDVNFDGQADINLDLDFDDIAETQLDSDGNCVFDYSIVDAGGATVSDAQIELREVSDQDGDSKFDTISEDSVTTITDSDGNFSFENIITGKTYILTIIKDRGDKLVWEKTVISIPDNATLNHDIGSFSLTSAPIVVGVETSLKEMDGAIGIPVYGKFDHIRSFEFDFEVGKSWYYKLYVEDINNSDVYRNVPYRNEEWEWFYHKLMFTKPNESESGFYEIVYEYELREDGCFNVTLNSYSPLWQDQGNFHKYCNWEDDMTYEKVTGFRDGHYINNSDDIYSAYNFDGGTDLYTRLGFNNSLYDPKYEYGLEVKSITINDIKYEWNDLPDVATSYVRKSLSIESETDSLSLSIQTEIDIIDTTKNLNIAYSSTNSENITTMGENINLDLDFNSYKLYQYNIDGAFCMLEIVDDGFCRGTPAQSIKIEYIPNIQEKPASIAKVLLNGVESATYLNGNVIEVGDTIELLAEFDDQNNLENEVQWRFINNIEHRHNSGWVSENEVIKYTFTTDDIGASFRIDINWRNNDEVAKEWGVSNDIWYEIDGWLRLQFSISE